MFFNPSFLLFLLPPAFAAPTTTTPTTTATSFASATPTSCRLTGLPTDVAPYFFLKTNTFNNDASPKNNIYLGGYHVGAGSSVAVLYPESVYATSGGPDLAYLNQTHLQWASQLLPIDDPIYWYLAFRADFGEVATPMMVTVFGESYPSGGFGMDDTTGLTQTTELFVGWLACDWFGTAGTFQLIPQFKRYWEGGDVLGLGSDEALPANCEAIHLIPEYPPC